MREILFRGKREDNDEWVEGLYQYYNWVNSITKEFIETTHHILPIGFQDAFKVIPETVGQYTGLTDYSEDKKKIFVGHIIKCRHEWTGNNKHKTFFFADDIISVPITDENEMQEAFEEQKIKGAYGKHTGENALGKCFYYYRNYVVEYYAPNGRYRVRNGSVFYDLTSSFIINRKAIIIGNIHDNPELLGGGEE